MRELSIIYKMASNGMGLDVNCLDCMTGNYIGLNYALLRPTQLQIKALHIPLFKL